MINISKSVQIEIENLLGGLIGLNPSTIGHHSIPRAVAERMAICSEADEDLYLKKFKRDPKEIQELIELIIVPETWFFRNKSSYDCLKEFIVKTRNKYPFKKFKVLCLPCSSGEEPYSVAMTFFEMGITSSNFSIEAIDLSEHFLAKAKTAIYHNRSFRNQNLDLRDKYFTETEEGYSLDSKIVDCVQFKQGNLFKKKNLRFPKYDIIFFRNLLIYFHPKGQQYSLKWLDQTLDDHGMLLVGAGESEIVRQYGFKRVQFPHAFAFSK